MLGSGPFCIQLIYTWCTANVPKDSLRLAQEALFGTIVRLLYASTFASPFYIYVLSSNEIRAALRGIMSVPIPEIPASLKLVAVTRGRVAPSTAPPVAILSLQE
ncbi:hypothetical protein I4U23_016590 [Adineta vaga]|nr:hypothetical protein I4U23_016590 [Adineta vaga]